MALSTPQEIQNFAQQLSSCADAFNARVKAEVVAGNLSMDEGFVELSNERLLREIANKLFLQAALLTITELKTRQEALEAVIATAQDKIKKFQKFAQALDLIADLIALGSAVTSGKLPSIVSTLREVRKDVKAIEANA